jgi:hypothetical protein
MRRNRIWGHGAMRYTQRGIWAQCGSHNYNIAALPRRPLRASFRVGDDPVITILARTLHEPLFSGPLAVVKAYPL